MRSKASAAFGTDELEAVAGFKKLYEMFYDVFYGVHANYTFTETQNAE